MGIEGARWREREGEMERETYIEIEGERKME